MQRVKSVLIVGAGSAGWLTAVSLVAYCPFLEVRIVRPRGGSPIGVGESTQPDLVQLLAAARIDFQSFYRASDATMKCGILYDDWNAIGQHYWHPFSSLAATGPFTAAHFYQQMILEGANGFSHRDYYAAVHTSYQTCIGSKQVAPESAAALHVDAHKITEFLESVLKGVEVLEADKVDVRTADGRVSGIVLDGKRISADLYVDCTGFSRALFERVAAPDILPYEANVNRVVAAQLPFADTDDELTPYTRAHAHDFGWTWSIPLQSRIGSGYCYHGDFCSPDQAERNFRAYWGKERMHDVAVRHISFDSLTLRNPWVENVVAIGLSAGFIEPLEASGLSWIVKGAHLLCQCLAVRAYDRDTSEKYNVNMLGWIYDVQDFIDAHYKLSARRDTEFWRYQTFREYPDRLEHRLALYGEAMPSNANRLTPWIWAFNEVSWLDILNGYRFKYRKLKVPAAQKAAAQRALMAMRSTGRPGIDPRKCFAPPSRADARVAAALAARNVQ